MSSLGGPRTRRARPRSPDPVRPRRAEPRRSAWPPRACRCPRGRGRGRRGSARRRAAARRRGRRGREDGVRCRRARRSPRVLRVAGVAGVLVPIEGIDGAGKTTLAAGLVEALRERGIEAEALREPGGVELSERVRDLVQDPALDVDPRAEALLYAAARAQLVAERVRPALDAGRWVLLDRFVDSSLAYQGAGRGLGIEAVRAVNDFGTGGLVPDRTLLLRIEPAAGRARAEGRGAAPDRLEREADAFFAEIARAYEDLAAAEPARVRVLDANLPPEELLAAALQELSDLMS